MFPLLTSAGRIKACDGINSLHSLKGPAAALSHLEDQGETVSRALAHHADDGHLLAWVVGWVGNDLVVLIDGIQTYSEAAALVTDVATGACWLSQSGFSPYLQGQAYAIEKAISRVSKDGEAVAIAGHSMGGAVASVLAALLLHRGTRPVQLLSLAAPRTGESFVVDSQMVQRERWFFPDDAIAGSVPRPSENATVAGLLGPVASWFASRQKHSFGGMAMMPDGQIVPADSPWQFSPTSLGDLLRAAGLVNSLVRGCHAVSAYGRWFAQKNTAGIGDLLLGASPTPQFVEVMEIPPAPLFPSNATWDGLTSPLVKKSLSAAAPRQGGQMLVLGKRCKATVVKFGDRDYKVLMSAGIILATCTTLASARSVAKGWNRWAKTWLNENVGISVGVGSIVSTTANLMASPDGGCSPVLTLS